MCLGPAAVAPGTLIPFIGIRLRQQGWAPLPLSAGLSLGSKVLSLVLAQTPAPPAVWTVSAHQWAEKDASEVKRLATTGKGYNCASCPEPGLFIYSRLIPDVVKLPKCYKTYWQMQWHSIWGLLENYPVCGWDRGGGCEITDETVITRSWYLLKLGDGYRMVIFFLWHSSYLIQDNGCKVLSIQ